MAGAQSIEKVHHIHECIINDMIAEPTVTQQELCKRFGYSVGWMSRLINSDSFQARLAERRQELLDPALKDQLNRRLKAVVTQSLDTIQQRLNSGPADSAELALASLGIAGTALGVLNPPKR